jgi:hypothetical protein
MYLVLSSHFALATAGHVPVINIERTCNIEKSPSFSKQDTANCVAGQKSAHDDLVKEWEQFPPADKSRCVRLATAGYLPSYVDLITCLELSRELKRSRLDDASHPKR